jgi:SAM-dependent methyltransferase
MSVPTVGLTFERDPDRDNAPALGGLREAVDDLFLGLLDDVHRRILADPADPDRLAAALDDLILALRSRWQNSAPDEWESFVDLCRRHPLLELLHHDPFTRRAYVKPRGYAGDAELIDYIYGVEEQWAPPPADPLGQRLFDYTIHSPATEGVRARRAFVAARIDRLAERRRRPHVLSVAAGHLREVNLSAAARRKRLGRLVGLDADPQSLAEIERTYGPLGVETVAANIRSLLAGKLRLGRFDLIYSLGLFDYLQTPVARRLVSMLFEMLRPGGQLIVANFLPGVRDVGYMEIFMDWRLIYRKRQDMVDLTAEIEEPQVREVRLFAEENHNIVFLELTRD